MKIIYSSLILIFFVFFSQFDAFSQSSTDPAENVAKPKIELKEINYDFGEISQGDQVEHSFEFKNIGNSPLTLLSVKTSCGCTASEWSKQPIAPGKSSNVKMIFNSSGKLGMQNKLITILSNAENNPVRVTITGNIVEKKEEN